MRALSYNILDGGGDRLDQIAAVIRNEAPHVAALQEATHDSAAALARGLGMELVFGRGNSIFDLHVAWLSRLPVRRSHNHCLPALAKTLLEIELDGVRLFTTHLTSRQEEEAHPRIPEVRATLGVLRAVQDPHLLVGDFNAVAQGDSVGDPPLGVVPRGDAVSGAPRVVLAPFAAAGYVDCYRSLHAAKAGWTYPAATPWLRLDYAFASSNLAERVRACCVVDGEAARQASDHLPLAVDLELNP